MILLVNFSFGGIGNNFFVLIIFYFKIYEQSNINRYAYAKDKKTAFLYNSGLYNTEYQLQ